MDVAGAKSKGQSMPFTPAVARLSARDRKIIGDDMHTGEVLHVAKSYLWVRPLGPLPLVVETEFSKCSEDDRKLYVARSDIAEAGLVLKVGTLVLFKCYKDQRGIGGCEIISA